MDRGGGRLADGCDVSVLQQFETMYSQLGSASSSSHVPLRPQVLLNKTDRVEDNVQIYKQVKGDFEKELIKLENARRSVTQ